MKILALESSAVAASAAVCEDEELIAQSFQHSGLTHSRTLLPMCRDLLQNCGLSLKEMDVVAVAAGPGSFTGLRIGVAAAKGLAWAADKPCAGVSTLEAMAWSLAFLEDADLCPVMDARCGQVYTALFSAENSGIARLREDEALSIEALCEIVAACGAPVTLVGDGSCLVYQTLKEKLPALLLAPPQLRLQRAACVGLAAEAALSAGEKPLPPEELLPSYLRLPQAERELQKKLAGQNN